MAEKGLRSQNCNKKSDRPYDWNANSIARILSKAEYAGHTVNFRTTKGSYKSKKLTDLPPEEWEVIYNTHEPIIDQETFDLVQKIRDTPKRTDSNGIANPLTGLVFCADCGAKMHNHKGSTKSPINKQTGLRHADCYQCSTYNLTRYHTDWKCTSHWISTSSLRKLTLETIRTVSEYAIGNQEAFVEKVRAASAIRQKESAKALQKKIRKQERRCRELDTLIQKLYESYALEKIPEKRFDALSANYEQEQADLEASIAEARNLLTAFEEDTSRAEEFLTLAKKYTDFSELTTAMINEFVDKIIVHQAEKDEHGERTQEVEIYLKYIGQIDLPAEAAVAEDPAEEERRKKQRAYKRDYYRKKKAQQESAAQKNELETA